jgi:hypothetical protein
MQGRGVLELASQKDKDKDKKDKNQAQQISRIHFTHDLVLSWKPTIDNLRSLEQED